MPNVLTNLIIKEVSSVDRGAGEGVKIMLMKRDKDKPMNKFASMFGKLFGGGQNNEKVIDKSVEGLAESVGSIISEASNPEDLSKSLATTFEQFGDHLKKNLTVEPVKKQEGSEMDLKIFAKSLGLSETATEEEVVAAIAKQKSDAEALAKSVAELTLSTAIAKAAFTADELAFYNKAEGEDDGSDKDVEKSAKKAFRLSKDRGAIMKAAAPAVSAEVQKVLDENAAMKKRLEALEAKESIAEFAKKAADIGLSEEHAETLQKAYSGDKTAIDKLIELTKAATAAAEVGGVFKEFGTRTNQTTGGEKAIDKLNQKATELKKAQPSLSQAQAFAKVYEDPANAELVAQERAENRPQVA